MTKLSNTTSTCEAQWKMWLLRVFTFIYFTPVWAAQDVTATSTLPDETTPMPIAVFDSPEPTLQQTSAYSVNIPKPTLRRSPDFNIIYPGDSINFTCNVDVPSEWKYELYKDGNKIEDLGSTIHKMASVTSSDNGEYQCKVKRGEGPLYTSDKVSLQVSANKPMPVLTRTPAFPTMYPGESITFTCTVDTSSEWEYEWYHNGTKIQSWSSNTNTIHSVTHDNSGEYRCIAQRGQLISNQSKAVSLQVSDPPTPILKLLSSWLEVFENESLKFSCELKDAEWTFTWHRDQIELQTSSESVLNIEAVRLSDQGHYTCKAHLKHRGVSSVSSNIHIVSVYDTLPIPTLSRDPQFDPIYAGETVKLKCTVNVSSGWSYHWYKNGTNINKAGKENSVTLSLSHNGGYSCTARRGDKTLTGHSKELQLHAREIPVPLLEQKTQWLDVFPSEGVELSCKMEENSGWIFTWFKNAVAVPENTFTKSEKESTLSITNASPSHRGNYSCFGQLKGRSVISKRSSEVTLHVYVNIPKPTLRRSPDFNIIYPGDSINFTCNVDVPSEWKYELYKDGNKIEDLGSTIHKMASVTSSDNGEYQCKVKRGEGPLYTSDKVSLQVSANKPMPVLTRTPAFPTMYPGESITFTCTVDTSSEWEYEWYHNGTKIQSWSSNTNTKISVTHDKSGEYRCIAQRRQLRSDQSKAVSLQVSEIPVPLLEEKTQWLDVFPSEGVELSCKMEENSGWIFTWFKNAVAVPENTFTNSEKESTLSITDASPSHRGNYSCSGQLKGRSVISKRSSEVTLHVYDEKPTVTLLQDPKDSMMHTSDFISFTCHVNVSSGWEYLWYKDSRNFAISGHVHNISSAQISQSGSYKCQVRRGAKTVFKSEESLPVNLQIAERPKASIILLTGWSDVFSTDSLLLKCEVTDNLNMGYSWNYTWSKEGKNISALPSQTHKVTPQDDPEQSLYTCQGFRNGRPEYSKTSDSYRTKNLLLKRRILLSISGCLFFGIIAVFLGCIALRVFRKPVAVEERQDEANLFLTMAQLKDRNDAPCPLVEYITDADLNQPSKEGEENGTNCSETTPLPITSPEEQAVTTNGKEATENGSGMVSFLH